MKLSDQALGAVMMALQNALMSQTDIEPLQYWNDISLTHQGIQFPYHRS